MAAGQREIDAPPPRHTSRRFIGLWPLVFTYVAVRAFWQVLDQSGRALDSILAPGLLKIGLWVVPCLALTMIVNRLRLRQALRELGLAEGLRAGVLFGFGVTVPLAAVLLIAGVQSPGMAEFVGVSILDPIGESVLFSGFVFSQLRRWNWRVGSALTASALLFGVAHSDGGELTIVGTLYRAALGLGVDMFWFHLRWFIPGLAALAAAGLLFTWVFHRWGTLWPTIGLHAAINFWWTLSGDRGMFSPSIWSAPTATGIAHGIVMVVAIVATIKYSALQNPKGPTTAPKGPTP